MAKKSIKKIKTSKKIKKKSTKQIKKNKKIIKTKTLKIKKNTEKKFPKKKKILLK